MENLIYLSDIKPDGSLVENVSLKWKVKNYSYVKEGDLIMEVSLSTGKIYKISSPRNGFLIRILYYNVRINSYRQPIDVINAKNVAIAGLYDSYEEYIGKCYKNESKIEKDDFTKQYTIKWKTVAKPLFDIIFFQKSYSFKDLAFSKKICYSSYGKNQIPLTVLINPLLSFSLVFEDGLGYIEFTYNYQKIKLNKNDTISFLFENGNIVDFTIPMKPYKIDETQNYKHFKCQLYHEDIDVIVNELICKWRISFSESGKSSLTTDIDSRPKLGKETILETHPLRALEAKALPLLIQKYAKDYINILHRKCSKYEFPQKIQPQNSTIDYSDVFDWCYVYLMKDLTNGYFKIGISNNPQYREHTLQSEKPTIEMIGNKKFPSRKIAEAFEKALHQAYSNQHIRGEWFSLSGFDVATILESFK